MASEFRKFKKLAPELQVMIWHAAAAQLSENPSIHFISITHGPATRPEDEESYHINARYGLKPAPGHLEASADGEAYWNVAIARTEYDLYNTESPEGDPENPESYLWNFYKSIGELLPGQVGGWFVGQHLSTLDGYAINVKRYQNLRQATATSRAEFDRLLSLQAKQRNSGKSHHQHWVDLRAGSEPETRALIEMNNDLVCLHLPLKPDGMGSYILGPQSTPYDLFTCCAVRRRRGYGAFSAAYPVFKDLKKLCFEIPTIWHDTQVRLKETQLRLRGVEEDVIQTTIEDDSTFISTFMGLDKRDFVQVCMSNSDYGCPALLMHFPSLRCLYFIDKEIYLDGGSGVLDPSSEVYASPEKGFCYVEVKRGNEQAWSHNRLQGGSDALSRWAEAFLYSQDPFMRTWTWLFDDMAGQRQDFPDISCDVWAPTRYRATTLEALDADASKMTSEDLAKSSIPFIRFALEQDAKRQGTPGIKLLAEVRVEDLDMALGRT